MAAIAVYSSVLRPVALCCGLLRLIAAAAEDVVAMGGDVLLSHEVVGFQVLRRNRPQQAETNRNRPQQAATGRNRPQQAATGRKEHMSAVSEGNVQQRLRR